MRSLADKHRLAVIVGVVVLLAAIVTTVVLSTRQPITQAAPPLPPAISAGPAASSSVVPTSLVVSVIGKVVRPGLVTLADGARVADALQAAGGVVPGTDDTALNLARRVADGEQIYVGIPMPAGQTEAQPDAAGAPSAGQSSTVDINTATEQDLETLPGIGPTMAQRILTWRGQHGHFDSVSQLRDVQGIGPGRFAKIKSMVTT